MGTLGTRHFLNKVYREVADYRRHHRLHICPSAVQVGDTFTQLTWELCIFLRGEKAPVFVIISHLREKKHPSVNYLPIL